jgi:hypothetical protein
MLNGREDGCPSSRGDNEFTFPLPCCSILAYHQLDGAYRMGWGRIFLTEPTGSRTKILKKHFHRHPKTMPYQPSGYFLTQSSWHLKLTTILVIGAIKFKTTKACQ